MQNTGEPMPKFFTGLDLCFFFFFFFFFFFLFFVLFCFVFVGKLEGGEKKMQISGEPMQSNKDMHINFISQISIYII